jgi:choline dehydrogenase-like flavoprotein
VHAHCLVERIVLDGTRAIRDVGRVLNRPGGRSGDRLEVRCERVVVATGAWHSPRLLRQSGIGRRSRALGRYMTLHPGFRVFGLCDEPVLGWHGALQSAYVDALEHEGVTLTSLFVPPGIVAATLPGVGDEHVRHAAEVGRIAVFGGMIHDDPVGTVHTWLGREPIVTYRMSKRDKARIPVLLRAMAEAFFAAGARQVFLPVLGTRGMTADAMRAFDFDRVPGRRYECASQHPLGTCQMGVEPRESVVDPDGKVWGLDNVFVACGSNLPTSLGVNPQLSIMSVATRVAWKMLGRA